MTPEDKWFCSGYLEKESKGENWNKRFFVLDEVSLKYFKKKPNPEEEEDLEPCRGEVKIKRITSVQHASAYHTKEWCIELKMSHGSNIYLVAANHEEMEDWIDNIVTHPLYSAAHRTCPANEDVHSPHRNGYTTKVVGGVVIRTGIHNKDELSDNGDAISVTTSADVSSAGGGGASAGSAAVNGLVNSSASASSIGTFMPISASSTSCVHQRTTHRRDGARVIMHGHCVKQGGARRNWKRRYFILDPFGFAYYRHKTDKEPLRNVPLPMLCSVTEYKCANSSRAHVLQLITIGRIFYMQTECAADLEAWIQALRSVLPSKPLMEVSPDVDRKLLPTNFGTPRASLDSAMTSGRQLWHLSVGRCREYLQQPSDSDTDTDEAPRDDTSCLGKPMSRQSSRSSRSSTSSSRRRHM